MATAKVTYYLKWTRKGRVPSYRGGDPIPVGEWTPIVENPVPRARGWHACRWEDALDHISDELWVCELDGRIVEGSINVAAPRLRLVEQVTAIDDRTLRLFAADCAERVLPIFERKHPNDPRPREAIRVARLYAEGEAAYGELAAARDAAWDPAWDPTWDAAAARAAAWAAATDAWRDAGGAARAAARDAAWVAAWVAAGDAAWDPTWDAAWDAERAWQADRLLCHYSGLDPADFAHRVVS